MTLEIQVHAWDRHKNVAGLNRLTGAQSFPIYTTYFFMMLILIS